MQDIRSAIDAKLRELVNLAAVKFPGNGVGVPFVIYKSKGLAGGRAHLQRNILEFNLTLAAADLPKFLREVVSHELAHLIAWRLYKDRGHGRMWRMVDLTLGGNGKRCFSSADYGICRTDLVARRRRSAVYMYRTASGHEVPISAVRHTKMVKNQFLGYLVKTPSGATERINSRNFTGMSG